MNGVHMRPGLAKLHKRINPLNSQILTARQTPESARPQDK